MPLFHRNVTTRSLFGSVLTQRLTAQATPIAAAQIASGVPPDQAATNAANAVVDATPPELIREVAPVYPQVTEWRVTRTHISSGPTFSDSRRFVSRQEAIDWANAISGPTEKTTVTELIPSGFTDKPPIEHLIYSSDLPADTAYGIPGTQRAQNEPLTTLPPVDPEAAAAEASAMKSCDSFYAQNRAYFEQRGYTSAKWASLSVNQKGEVLRQAINQDIAQAGPIQATQTPPEPQYVASRPAETTVIQTPVTNEQAAAAMAEIDAFYTQNQSFFTQNGYGPDRWVQMSIGQKSEVINAATSGTLTGGAAPVAPAAAPAPATADTVAVTYDLQIEGANSGSFAKLEDAVTAALGATTPGDRFEVLYNGKTSGLRIRTTTGSVDVPADIDGQVRLLSRDKMGQFVVDAETKTAATGGGIPWWLLPIAGAAAVATRFL